MFDEFRLKEALVSYKRDFAQKLWPNEKYKWQAVKCFQLNWDVNATDFAEMLKKSLSATANLLASVNNFPARMIQKFAEIVPEEVRAMFIELFDESKDVYERINSFKLKSSLLLERYGNGAAQHYQNENSISTYLWLRYPDKYYIFKLSEVKVVASELESDYRFKKGAYADNIHKLSSPLMLENINTILKNNPALLETWQTIALEDILGRELIVDSCYVPIEGQALRKNLMSLSV